MSNGLRPGQKGERLPNGVVVLRLGRLSSDALESSGAHVAHFELSSEDKTSDLQSLSVWAVDLTPVAKAREFMGDKRADYRLALYLNVDDIRAVRFPQNSPEQPLDVVWDPMLLLGTEGHAGILGLHRPDSAPRAKYKALRAKLAALATVEILPE